MVTSTSSSGSSGPCGRRATRGARCWSWSVGQNLVSGPGDNWSRVRDQRLKGQTGQSVLMGRWAGRPGRCPTPTGLRDGRGDDADMGLVRGLCGRIGVVGVIDVQIVVEVEILVLVVLVLVVLVLVVLLVLVIEVLIVKVLVLVLVLVVVEVDLVVFFIGVLEVAATSRTP